ncbi:MAG: LacI family transcriptional regulator, partial [Colwellia sp.]|nr:LacI family transcriptional regulator [Colwellia sp.]
MTTYTNNKTSAKNKKVTVFDVARHAGVSKSTVSLVLTQSDKV